jgi:hypothetical protein
MSSTIDPDSAKKVGRPVQAPAGARPMPPKPAAPPAKAGAQQPANASAANGEDEEEDSIADHAKKQAPAWAISMLVHIVVLLAMALIVSEPPKKDAPRVITSSGPEVEEEFTETPEDLPEQTAPTADPTAEVAVTTEVAVTPVEVVAHANDLDAAPLAVEFTDFGTETAPASDMMATMGAVGGKAAGGLGGRAQAAKMAAAGGGGGDTEQAVDRALKWLAIHQMPDGGWSFDLEACPSCQGKCSHPGKGKAADRCGATGLALLPFLGRGYTHREGPYKSTVEKGISFLAALAVDGQGKAYRSGGSMYSQGIAGIALSECYAMSQDNRLAGPTQQVLNFIMQAQDPRGGGWRYEPRQPGDTSAVGWQIMALKSGNMAYLQVNPLTIKKAVDFLNSVQSKEGANYGYTDNSRTSPGRTAVGLLCRMYLGWKKDNAALQEGVKYLAKTGPNRDLYYDYYATQIMHHMEGEMWIAWNKRMKEMLLKSQSAKGHEEGSWYDEVNGGHGADSAGRLYCTALSTMILEVYYRHLPIYRTQVVDEEFKE